MSYHVSLDVQLDLASWCWSIFSFWIYCLWIFNCMGAMCIMSLHQDICTHMFSWYCILLTKFSWLSCAVAKVIQCLQEYGDSNFIPELTGQHLHSTLWSHSESKFPSSFASFLIAGALWNLSFVIICMFSYYLSSFACASLVLNFMQYQICAIYAISCSFITLQYDLVCEF